MKKLTHSISIILASAILFASCSSTTMIQSTPTKAKVYLNGEYKGVTPYTHTDTKIVGTSMVVKLEKEGYSPLVTTITKDEEVNVGAIIGGLFVGVPFLWTMKYQATHNYELRPIGVSANEDTVTSTAPIIPQNTKSRAARLRELKQLLDEKIITQAEFDKEKAKVLEMQE